jgi:hypothetical protein
MLLADYSSDNRCFEFDAHTGVYSHITLPSPRTTRAGYSGQAQLLRSPADGKVLVAKYLFAGDPWLSIGPDRWRFLDGSVVARHRERLGVFLCELTLHRDGRCIQTFRYYRRDWFAAIIDPAYDHLDFSLANLPVDLEPHDLSPIQEQREDFVAMWTNPSKPDTSLETP